MGTERIGIGRPGRAMFDGVRIRLYWRWKAGVMWVLFFFFLPCDDLVITLCVYLATKAV